MTGNVVKLRDSESEWSGVSRVDYTLRRRAAVRAAERARRALWLQRNVPILPRDRRGLFVAVPSLSEGDVFETASGQRAYRRQVPNRLSLTSSAINEATRHALVSLPFVSILFASP